MDEDSFSNYPKTIGEIKADKEESAEAWTPRDALIDTLRRIDEGELDLSDVVIVMRRKSGVVNWTVSTKERLTGVLGMIENVKLKIFTAYNE